MHYYFVSCFILSTMPLSGNNNMVSHMQEIQMAFKTYRMPEAAFLHSNNKMKVKALLCGVLYNSSSVLNHNRKNHQPSNKFYHILTKFEPAKFFDKIVM